MDSLKIYQARRKYGITQYRAAELAGYSESSFSKLLRRDLPDEEGNRILNLIEEEGKRKALEALTGKE